MYKLLLTRCWLAVALALLPATLALAQFEGPQLGAGPFLFQTFEQDYVKASVVARGMDHPFGLVFLPGTADDDNPLGDLLISERSGKLRLLRSGALQAAAVIDLKQSLPL